MTITLPSEDALESMVREVAQEFPDANYNPLKVEHCYYSEDTDTTQKPENCPPGCLIGVALSRLGVDTVELDDFLARYPFKDIGSAYALIRLASPTPAMQFIKFVQANQDHGFSWGHAVAKADEELAILANNKEELEGATEAIKNAI